MPEIIEQIIRYEAETGDAEKQLKKLKNEQSDLGKAFKKLARDTSLDTLRDDALALAKQTGDVTDAARKLGKELRDVGATQDEIDRVSKEFRDMAVYAEEAAQAARNVAIPQQKFATTSENVALAGDAESQLRTITGAIGALGGDFGAQIEQAVNAFSEGLAVLEAAPKLKETISGVGAILQNMGPLGVATLGAAAALAAFQVAMIAVNQANAELRESFNSQVEAQRSLNAEIAGGLTTSDAQQRLAELNRELELQAPLLDDLNNAYGELEQGVGIAGAAVKTFSDDEEALYQQLEAQRGTVRDLQTERDALNSALENGRLAANDMKAAEEELAATRAEAALAAGQEAAALEQARQQTRDASQEQLDQLVRSEQDRIDVLRAELEALRASGDTSEQVTNRIKQLEQQLQTSERRLETFGNATASTTRSFEEELQTLRDTGEESEETALRMRELERQIESSGDSATQAAGKFEQAAQQINATGQRLASQSFRSSRGVSSGRYTAASGLRFSASAQRQINAGRARLGLKPLSFGNTSQAQQQTASTFNRGVQSATSSARNLANEWANITNRLNQSIYDAKKRTKDALDDLARSTAREVSDALSEGNFLAIANVEKQRQRQVQDIRIAERRSIRDARQQAQANRNQAQPAGISRVGSSSGGNLAGTLGDIGLSQADIDKFSGIVKQGVRRGTVQVLSTSFRKL